MDCILDGAVILESAGDPDILMRLAPGARCRCDAKSPYEIETGKVRGRECAMFRGCPFLLQGRMIRPPDEWPEAPNANLDLWPDAGATEPVKAKADDLRAREGFVREISREGIRHVERQRGKSEEHKH